MRIKIKLPQYDINQLVFGKKYYIAYGGCSYGQIFIFTRKNKIELCDYINDQETGKQIKKSSYWVSKIELKQLLNSGAIHWMGEYKKNE